MRFWALCLLAGCGATTDGARHPENAGAQDPCDSRCASQGAALMKQAGESARASTPDLGRAASLFAQACKIGYAAGCVAHADALIWGRGVPHDVAAAVAGLERACELDDATGCVALGRARERGLAKAPDPLAAFDMYRKAAELDEPRCAKGDAAACSELGALMREGSGVPEDRQGGLALQARACRAKHAPGCIAWMKNGDRYQVQPGAIEALSRACQGGDGASCVALAHVGHKGAWLELGCRAGHGASCNALGIERFPPDGQRFAALERACALGDGPGCHHLALALELPGDRHDTERAAQLHERSCSSRWGPACTRLGVLLASGEGVALDVDRAAWAFRQGCELGSAAGCFELGVLRQEGTRVTGDPKQGSELIERACRRGDGRACTRIARQAMTNRDQERDPERARSLLDDACTAGHARACLDLAPLAEYAEPLARARTHAVPACEAALTVCREGKPVAVATAWSIWADAPARVLVDAPACDERLERVCLDAVDALSESCRRVDGAHCSPASELVERLASAGLGPDREQAEMLERLKQKQMKRCKQDARYCP